MDRIKSSKWILYKMYGMDWIKGSKWILCKMCGVDWTKVSKQNLFSILYSRLDEKQTWTEIKDNILEFVWFSSIPCLHPSENDLLRLNCKF